MNNWVKNALRWVAVKQVVLLLLLSSVAVAQQPASEGLLGRRARLEASMQSIPFDRIDRNAGEAVRDVLSNPSFYRQLPPKMLEADPRLMKFMVRHPEVMVNIWEMIGITNIEAKRTGDRTFYANDGAGTTCNCELIYSDDATHIYYGTGNYDGPLSPRTIKGRVVCVLRSTAQQNPLSHSGYVVQSRMDVFLKVDNFGADLLTRTLGPLVGKVTEHNFEETSKFVGQLSEFCAADPDAAQKLAAHLDVSRESIRHEFASIATRIGNRQGNAIAHPLSPSATSSVENLAPIVSAPQTLAETELLLADAAPAEAHLFNLKSEIGEVRIATLPDLALDDELSPSQAPGNPSKLEQSPSTLKTSPSTVQPHEIIPRKPTLQLRR